MYFGYNTNGFAHHRLDDAIAILADLGYGGVGITVDWHVLNPHGPDWLREAERTRRLLERHKMRSVVETGARFLLDPRRKHQPTLLSPDPNERQRRLSFLVTCVELAKTLGSDCVSFWSGTAVDGAPEEELWRRLTQGCHALAAEADQFGVALAFEPEPGMFVDTLASFRQLQHHLGDVELGLTMDVGHVHCLGEEPVAERIVEWRKELRNVHIEDMCRGVHDHRMFGEGEMRFGPILAALDAIDYRGGAFVELSRHSHDAVRVAETSLEFLASARVGDA